MEGVSLLPSVILTKEIIMRRAKLADCKYALFAVAAPSASRFSHFGGHIRACDKLQFEFL